MLLYAGHITFYTLSKICCIKDDIVLVIFGWPHTPHDEKIFCLCKNKGTDQLRSNCKVTAKLINAFVFVIQVVQFKYNKSSSKIRNLNFLAFFCDCTYWFVSDLFGNHVSFLKM